MEQADADFAAAQGSITDQTTLKDASEQFNSAAVALEFAWLRLFADAGCIPDEQAEQAQQAVSAYVSGLQQNLTDAGYYGGEVDGVYGPDTVAAVEELQKANDLPVTGTVDNATAAALQAELLAAGGEAAAEVFATTAAVQQTLKLAGFWDGPIDGTWTPELTDAVKAFQKELGVEPTGDGRLRHRHRVPREARRAQRAGTVAEPDADAVAHPAADSDRGGSAGGRRGVTPDGSGAVSPRRVFSCSSGTARCWHRDWRRARADRPPRRAGGSFGPGARIRTAKGSSRGRPPNWKEPSMAEKGAEVLVDFIISLDGFASAEGWPGWWGLEGPEYLRWIEESPEKDFTILMGATTYRLMSGFLAPPGEPGSLDMSDDEQASVEGLAGMPKLVFSSTLQPPYAWPRTEVVRRDAVEEVAERKRAGISMRTIGSLSLCRSLLEAGLVDRFRVVIFPVITGRTGRERIYDGYPDVALELIDSRLFDGRIQLLEYAPTLLTGPPGARSER